MGKAKLNIWVRGKNCRVIKRTGHLHIYNCLGEEVFAGWVIKDGHAEVELPPGCYIVRAGMRGGNIYSDRAIVIVRCEESACINLILPNFVEKEVHEHVEEMEEKRVKFELLAGGGCIPPVMLALGIEALKRENINIEELKTAYKVLMKAANIDKKQILCEISMEIEETHQNLDEMDAEERREAREYINILEKLKEILKST
jgi:hypothetical protein